MAVEFQQEAVEQVHKCLDELGLKRAADELVVVGGAAMAAYGIKNITKTDLDIAVTSELMDHLAHDDRWAPSSEHQMEEIVATKKGIEKWVKDPERYVGLVAVRGNVTAITPPLEDSTYHVSNYELIAEGVVPEEGHYRFSPLVRILDWKLTLVGNAEYQEDKEKHFQDARKIASFLAKLKGQANIAIS